MLPGHLKLLELARRATAFAERYQLHGVDGFATGSINKEYSDLLDLLDSIQFEHLNLDSERLSQVWEPEVLKIA